jgi:hypothetical protein
MLTVTATNGLNFVKNLSIAPAMKNLISIAIAVMFSILIENIVKMKALARSSIMIRKSRVLKSRIRNYSSSKVL